MGGDYEPNSLFNAVGETMNLGDVGNSREPRHVRNQLFGACGGDVPTERRIVLRRNGAAGADDPDYGFDHAAPCSYLFAPSRMGCKRYSHYC